MFDTTQPSGGEPEEVTKAGEEADAQTTTAQNEKSAEAESKTEEVKPFDENLLLETEEKPIPQRPKKEKQREIEAAKALNTWTNRLANADENPKTNEPYSLDDVPSWLQPKVEENLKKLGGIEEDAPKEAKVLSENDILDKLEFRQLLKTIPDLPDSKQSRVQSKFKYYQGKGMNQLNSLQETLNVMSKEDDAFARGLNRGLRAAPPEGEPVMKQKKSDLDEAKKSGKLFGLTPEDYEKYEKSKAKQS